MVTLPYTILLIPTNVPRRVGVCAETHHVLVVDAISIVVSTGLPVASQYRLSSGLRRLCMYILVYWCHLFSILLTEPSTPRDTNVRAKKVKAIFPTACLRCKLTDWRHSLASASFYFSRRLPKIRASMTSTDGDWWRFSLGFTMEKPMTLRCEFSNGVV